MQHYHSLADVSIQNAWLTIGVFDGVHGGHQAILRRLVAGAQANGSPAVLLTFDPPPAAVLAERSLKLLTTPNERAELASGFGVDVIITHPFDQTVSNLSAHDFMTHVKEHLGLVHLLIGYDFALGKNREGDARRLTELGNELGYSVEILEAVNDEGVVISSTEIRKLISLGNMEEAARLLGRTYSLSGPVVHGDGRGHHINIPTANIQYPVNKLLPANGIYACRARIGQDSYAAATNIGYNPTFTPEKRIANVEAHLLDFDRDLYGEQLTLEFVSRLRDEMRFDSVNDLLAQIYLDIEQTRRLVLK